MIETKYRGVASAWKEGEQWFYVTEPNAAPNGAARVELFELDGRAILFHSTDRSGFFVGGAIEASDRCRHMLLDNDFIQRRDAK
jgi:hypothetical protein